jgi:hypothetical protein
MPQIHLLKSRILDPESFEVCCNLLTLLMRYLYQYQYRAFNEILKADCTKFGVGEEYIIGDTVADEWQQHVNNVIAGTTDAV